MKSFLKRNLLDLIIIVSWIIDLVITKQKDISFLLIICLLLAHFRIITKKRNNR